MRKTLYQARWGFPSIANVSFEAASDYRAIQRADKIARELGVTNTPRTITASGGRAVEAIQRGVSE